MREYSTFRSYIPLCMWPTHLSENTYRMSAGNRNTVYGERSDPKNDIWGGSLQDKSHEVNTYLILQDQRTMDKTSVRSLTDQVLPFPAEIRWVLSAPATCPARKQRSSKPACGTHLYRTDLLINSRIVELFLLSLITVIMLSAGESGSFFRTTSAHGHVH
jgi:hypothetical protein